MEGGSSTLGMKSLLFLSFSAKWASKSPIGFLFKYFEEVAEEMHSRKWGVRVGGSNWITFPAASRRGILNRRYSMAKNFPNLAGTGGAEVVEMFSREGLEGVILTWEASSGAILMVLGGVWIVVGVGVVDSRVDVA